MSAPAAVNVFKRRIAARFGRAAEAYEAGAEAQREIARRAAEFMRGGIGAGELWCDFGSGGGMMLEYLRELPGGTRFVCLDLAYAALRRAIAFARTGLAINGDIDFPPVKPETLNGATAVSSLQWVASPEDALQSVALTLKPSGRFYFAVFVDGSFEELVVSRSRAGLPPVVWLPAIGELLAVLDDCGFDVSADSVENFHQTQYFPTALAALGSMSGTGVTATGGRLLGRRELDELCGNYTRLFSKNGKVSLTYRAVIGKAVKKTALA